MEEENVVFWFTGNLQSLNLNIPLSTSLATATRAYRLIWENMEYRAYSKLSLSWPWCYQLQMAIALNGPFPHRHCLLNTVF